MNDKLKVIGLLTLILSLLACVVIDQSGQIPSTLEESLPSSTPMVTENFNPLLRVEPEGWLKAWAKLKDLEAQAYEEGHYMAITRRGILAEWSWWQLPLETSIGQLKQLPCFKDSLAYRGWSGTRVVIISMWDERVRSVFQRQGYGSIHGPEIPLFCTGATLGEISQPEWLDYTWEKTARVSYDEVVFNLYLAEEAFRVIDPKTGEGLVVPPWTLIFISRDWECRPESCQPGQAVYLTFDRLGKPHWLVPAAWLRMNAVATVWVIPNPPTEEEGVRIFSTVGGVYRVVRGEEYEIHTQSVPDLWPPED